MAPSTWAAWRIESATRSTATSLPGVPVASARFDSSRSKSLRKTCPAQKAGAWGDRDLTESTTPISRMHGRGHSFGQKPTPARLRINNLDNLDPSGDLHRPRLCKKLHAAMEICPRKRSCRRGRLVLPRSRSERSKLAAHYLRTVDSPGSVPRVDNELRLLHDALEFVIGMVRHDDQTVVLPEILQFSVFHLL